MSQKKTLTQEILPQSTWKLQLNKHSIMNSEDLRQQNNHLEKEKESKAGGKKKD